MRAVTFQAPGEVRIDEKADPQLVAADDALVRVEASGICGSDLHIYHGRVPVEPGFTIGHEFVGTVLAAGEEVERVAVGDRVLGTFHTACATCASCLRGDYHRCRNGQTFGHGANLGDLQGAQAELLLVPRANLTLRRVPEGMSADVALFAGDVMGTGYHADAGTVSGIGAYAGKGEVPLGLAWLKGLQLRLGLANVIAHVDRVLALMEAGKLDPSPLVTHRMGLDEAAEAYEVYDKREALKIVLTP